MNVKCEEADPDDLSTACDLSDGSKRIRKQTQSYTGQLKGENMEAAFESALHQLDRQSFKIYGYKKEPASWEQSNENQHPSFVSNLINGSPPIISQNCTQEYQWQLNQGYQNEHLPNVYNNNALPLGQIERPKFYRSGSITREQNDNLPVYKTPNGGSCGVCGKQFSRMDTCKNHFIQVHGESFREKDIHCLVCKEAFAFKNNLSSHMKKVHGISDRIEIVKGSDGLLAKTASGKGVCLICCKVFSRLDTCKNHFKTHQNLSENVGNTKRRTSGKHKPRSKEPTSSTITDCIREQNFKNIKNVPESISITTQHIIEKFMPNDKEHSIPNCEIANGIHEQKFIKNEYETGCTASIKKEDSQMLSMEQNSIGFALDVANNNYSTEVKQETYQNCNLVIKSNDKLFIHPIDTENKISSEFNEINKQTSSDTNVENQLDSTSDFSGMPGFKQEVISQRYHNPVHPLSNNKVKQNFIDEKLPLHMNTIKQLKESKNSMNIKTHQVPIFPEIKIAKMESGKALCEVCGKVFFNIYKAKDHFLNIHGEESNEKNFFCEICGKGYVFKENLKAHMKSVHKISSELIPYEGYEGHLAKTKEGSAFCLLCRKKYFNIYKAKDHYNKIHSN